jgi:transcriptional regulator with XRE-family HTH domain
MDSNGQKGIQMLYREALGEILRETRLAQNKTMRQVSGVAFMALGYLSEVERGQKELSSEPLENLARSLNLEPYELIFKTAMRMAGVDVPNSPAEMFDERLEIMVK